MKSPNETSQPDFKHYLSCLSSCRRGRGWAESVQSVLQEAVLHRLFLSVRRWSGATQREDDAAAQTEGTCPSDSAESTAAHSLFKTGRASQEVWLQVAPIRTFVGVTNKKKRYVYLHFQDHNLHEKKDSCLYNLTEYRNMFFEFLSTPPPSSGSVFIYLLYLLIYFLTYSGPNPLCRT